MVELYNEAKPVLLSKYSNDDVACTLKQYIRTLKSPLITYELYHSFMATSVLTEDEDKIQHIQDCLDQLPHVNYIIVRYLLAHLHTVSQASQKNLMTTANLGMVFGPVMFRKQGNESTENAMAFLQDLSKLSGCIKFMIEHYDTIFFMTPEEGHVISDEDYAVDWRDIALGKVPFPRIYPDEPLQEEEQYDSNREIEPENDYSTNDTEQIVNNEKSEQDESYQNASQIPDIPNESSKEISIENSSVLPPPPSIDIEEARKNSLLNSNSDTTQEIIQDTTNETLLQNSTQVQDSKLESEDPSSPSRRFNILTQSTENRNNGLSNQVDIEHNENDNSLLLSPPPKPKEEKKTVKKSYSLFAHMLTSNPTIISILQDQNIFPLSSLADIYKKLLNIAITIGSTHHLLRTLLELEFQSQEVAGSQSTGILRANSLLSKLLDELVNVEGSSYLRRMFIKQILLIIDTENARIVLSTKDGKNKKEKAQQSAVFERNKQKLVALVDMFIRTIISERSQRKMPDDIKYVCTILKDLSTSHNLNVSTIIASFVMLRMYNPVIVNPESINITTTSGKPITDDQKKILILVSKVLQKIGNNTRFNKTDTQMSCMNLEVERHIPSLAKTMERLGFSLPELQSFIQHRGAISAQNIATDVVLHDANTLAQVREIYEKLVQVEETVSQQDDENRKLVLSHLLSIFPEGDRNPNPELLKKLKDKKIVDNTKTKSVGSNDLLIPSSDLPIHLESPFESLSARIDDCRKKQGIILIPDILTMTNLQLVIEKQLLKRELHLFDLEFEAAYGREPQKEDKAPLRSIYQRYKQVRVVMSSKGLSYSRDVYERIAEVAQMQITQTSGDIDDQENNKKSKFSLNQLSDDERITEKLKSDAEYNRIRSYKREVQKLLHQYQDYFELRFGRKIRTKQDGEPMKQYYDIYKFLKYELVRISDKIRNEIISSNEINN